MNPGTNCITIVKHFESFRPKPYLCTSNKATIGYGSTFYPNGLKVTLQDAPISEKVAYDLMLWEITNKATAVNKFLTAPVNQAQYDALISFAYNCGAPALKTSTLMRYINAGYIQKEGGMIKITNEFKKWIHSAGKKSPGLIRRRACEAHLFTHSIVKFFN